MVRLFIVFATLISATSLSAADDLDSARNARTAGTKGTVTAWDESATRVIEHRFCVRSRLSWDYVRCGSRLRDEVKRQLCTTRGAGTHRYLYQVGDGRPMKSMVSCRR